jgi:hypothetical protein
MRWLGKECCCSWPGERPAREVLRCFGWLAGRDRARLFRVGGARGRCSWPRGRLASHARPGAAGRVPLESEWCLLGSELRGGVCRARRGCRVRATLPSAWCDDALRRRAYDLRFVPHVAPRAALSRSARCVVTEHARLRGHVASPRGTWRRAMPARADNLGTGAVAQVSRRPLGGESPDAGDRWVGRES